MTNARLAHLDALRGWAILGVIVVHVGNHIPGPIHESTRDGARGVELFYTLSALTLFLTWRKCEANPIRSFFVRRFFRIAPMFYLTIAFYAVASWIWNFGAPLEHRMSLARAATLALFVNGFSPHYLNGLFGEWSVATEMMFYALVPLLYRLVKRIDRAIILTVGALLAGWSLTEWARIHPLVSDAEVWDTYMLNWFPNHWSSFTFGIVAFYILQKPPAQKHASTLLSAALALLVAAYVIKGDLFALPHHMLFEIGFVPLIVSLHLRPNPVLVNRPICYLGRISYSCYLVHNAIKDRVVHSILALPFSAAAKFSALFAVVFVGTLVVASLTYRFVEQPGIALGKRLIDRRRESPQLPEAAHAK